MACLGGTVTTDPLSTRQHMAAADGYRILPRRLSTERGDLTPKQYDIRKLEAETKYDNRLNDPVVKELFDAALAAIESKHKGIAREHKRAVQKSEERERKLATKRAAAAETRAILEPLGLVLRHDRLNYHSSDETKPRAPRKQSDVDSESDDEELGFPESDLGLLSKKEREALAEKREELVEHGYELISKRNLRRQSRKRPPAEELSEEEEESESPVGGAAAAAVVAPRKKAKGDSAEVIALIAANKKSTDLFTEKLPGLLSQINSARLLRHQAPPLSGARLSVFTSHLKRECDYEHHALPRPPFYGSVLRAVDYSSYINPANDPPVAAAAAAQ